MSTQAEARGGVTGTEPALQEVARSWVSSTRERLRRHAAHSERRPPPW